MSHEPNSDLLWRAARRSLRRKNGQGTMWCSARLALTGQLAGVAMPMAAFVLLKIQEFPVLRGVRSVAVGVDNDKTITGG